MIKDITYHEAEIKRLHSLKLSHPSKEKEYEAEIKKLTPYWATLLNITIHVANNEQKPLPEHMLGHTVVPMDLKATTGYDQTGDYIFTIENYPHLPDWNRYGGIIFERKSISDLYGTLFGDRERFYDEIDRFYSLPWADMFIVLVEGYKEDFDDYVPYRKYCKFCKSTRTEKNTEGKKVLLCTAKPTPRPVKAASSCFAFRDKQTREERLAIAQNSKDATIDALNVRPGVQVEWCGSRDNMARTIKGMIRQWCMQNYERVLGLTVPVTEFVIDNTATMEA